MIERDKAHFKRLLTKLAGVFLREVNSDLIDSYFTALRSTPLHSVEVSCRRAAAEMQFFPKPAELRQLAPSAHRPVPREIDGKSVYECFRCRDEGVEIVDRKDGKGRGIGTFARPCLCPTGEAVARGWESQDYDGKSMADSARDVSRKLHEMGATEA